MSYMYTKHFTGSIRKGREREFGGEKPLVKEKGGREEAPFVLLTRAEGGTPFPSETPFMQAT